MTGQLIWSMCAVGLCTVAAQAQRVSVHVGVGNVNVGVSVATRGPVHEAYAEPVVFEPEPGVTIAQAPPAPIDEMVPDERPEGEFVRWVPGYWGWDDEANAHVWLSGVWRNLPPGRQFVPGYWAPAPGGYQWVSGFWMNAQVQQVEYLPPPPAPLSVEPIGVAAAPDQIWVPGVWTWRSGRYVWRQGYWLAPQVNWTWVPSHYVWTPSGFVYVSGYWDYTLQQRGLLFAPVVLDRAVIARPNFVYTPSVVVNAQVLVGNLFARPRYSHYYFGDYYAPEYHRVGIIPVYEFQRSRRGFSSIYAQTLVVERRRDPRWEDKQVRQYEMRRDRVDARPPRTWADMEKARSNRSFFANSNTRDNLNLVSTLKEASASRDPSRRLQATPQDSREEMHRRAMDLRQFQDSRRKMEVDSANKAPGRPGRDAQKPINPPGNTPPGRAATNTPPTRGQTAQPAGQPLRLAMPRSPFVGRPVRGGDDDASSPARGQPRERTRG